MTQTDSRRKIVLRRQDGIAMLTILMLTIILTVIGIAAITTTSLDIWMAGGERLRESSVNMAEACLSSGVQIVQQTLLNAQVPAALTAAGSNPSIPLPLGGAPGANPLELEILGQSNQNSDNADPSISPVAPNAVLTLGGYIVNMDIDRLYARPKPGGALQFASGYEGIGAGAAGGGVEILYKIDCFARTSGTAQSSVQGHISGVYACVASGDTCQRKI